MRPADVTAVLITTGGFDLTRVVESLRNFRETRIVYPPCEGVYQYVGTKAVYPIADRKVFGRYVQASLVMDEEQRVHAENWARKAGGARWRPKTIVYVQDDDCLTDAEAIVAAYKPGVVVCNMPAVFRPNYQDRVALVGFGAVFDADLIQPAFDRYLTKYAKDDLFLTECDRVFTKLNVCEFVDIPKTDLPHAFAKSRLYRRDDHNLRTAEIRRRLETL